MNVGHHAMCGKNDQAFAARVDEGHHGSLVGGVGIGRSGACTAFIAVIERGFVAVVAVCNDQFLISHGLLNCVDTIGLRDRPQAMNHVVLVGEFRCRRRGRFGFG